jgi:hypothetical protein
MFVCLVANLDGMIKLKIRHFSLFIVNPKLAHMPMYLCVSVPIYHSACACISSIACLFISAYLFLDPIVCKSLHHCICLFLCQPIRTSIMFVCLFVNLAGMIEIRHFSLLIGTPKLARMPMYLCGSMTVYPSVHPRIS